MYPAELVYNNVNPKGFFSTFKQWIIQPIANGGHIWPGQNVRILIQSILNGVMDPYRSHIQLTVSTTKQSLPVGLLQVDSSAQSFIEQLVISSKNKQIQRIPQYSVLAAWLTDIGLAQMYAQGRQTQGLGYNNVQSFNNLSKSTAATNSGYFTHVVDGGMDPKNPMIGRSSGLVFPTQTSSIIPRYFLPIPNQTYTPWNQPFFYSIKNTKGIMTPANVAWLNCLKQHNHFRTQFQSFDPKDNRQWITQALINQTGYLQNLRAQYLQSMQNNKYPDSTTSSPTHQIHLNSELFLNKQTTPYTTKQLIINKDQYYKPFVPATLNVSMPTQNDPTKRIKATLPNQASFWGYSTLYSPNFCKGTHEPFISATVPQIQMENGKILRQKKPLARRTFKIPLISAILGLLIPEDQFVLLPIKALNDVLIQLVIDKYAMFTSGYLDISELDWNGAQTQQLRAFGIDKLTYNMHTYSFWDPQIDQYLNKVLMDRILINCNMWTLGNQYTINKGDHLTNNWPVACTSQALNQIVVLCIPSDYQKYSFCRKHFRLSNNVTKFQLRVNMEYFPPMPIIGNGGNPCLSENNDDNSNFIQQIFWSNNFMFNKVNPFPRINSMNFAINQRCYDVAKQGPMYPTTLQRFEPNSTTAKTGYVGWDKVVADKNYKTFNLDTSMGQAWVHENRYVGKAGYVYSFQPYAHSQYFLVGLDCRNIRQFDVLLTAGTVNSFPRQQQMYIFTRSSVVISFTNQGIATYGR